MSRCFPYNPLSGGEKSSALIDSIKLQKKEKSEDGRQKKREKKQKKHIRELKRTVHVAQRGNVAWKHPEMNQLHMKQYLHQGSNVEEFELLEKSGLTEEQDLVYLPSTRGQDSPDSSRYKEQKVDASVPNRISHASLLLRIRVPSYKVVEPERPSPEESVPYAPAPTSLEQAPCSTGRVEATVAGQKCKSQTNDTSGPVVKGFAGCKRSRRGDTYDDLFGSWVSQLQPMEKPDDEEWLFKSEPKQQDHDQKRCRAERKPLFDSRAVLAWPPRASCLTEAGLYALPFVVPF